MNREPGDTIVRVIAVSRVSLRTEHSNASDFMAVRSHSCLKKQGCVRGKDAKTAKAIEGEKACILASLTQALV